ncbi:MAG: hypothetical protein PHQ43_14760, partial [Dehalococcoidales bacterium]|nr:hypothetical protein [Dehalococcoidales bacterium]
MVTKTFEYKAIKYDELGEDAKDKALEQMYDLNTYYGWWECTVEDIQNTWEEKYGICFDTDALCFDLGRRRELYFHGRGKIRVENPYKLAYQATGNKGYALQASNGLLELYFETNYYGGGSGRTVLHVSDYRTEKAPDLPVDFDLWFRDLCHDFWSTLHKEYDYLTSRESIEEGIRANEYD